MFTHDSFFFPKPIEFVTFLVCMARRKPHNSDSRLPALRRALAPMACVFALFYLGFHAVSGDRGVLALFKENRRLATLEAQLEEVKAKRQSLEKKVTK